MATLRPSTSATAVRRSTSAAAGAAAGGATQDQAAPQRAGLIDPATLMRIKNLQLRARVVVQGFLSGLHRSPYHGFSVEFSEYRQYTPGDDLRYLDWRLYARSDRHYIKRFEDETNLRCFLLVDLSRSMGFQSLTYDKAEYAKTAAATFAYYLSLQRDAVGLVTFDEQIQEYLPARFRPGHLHRIMLCLERSLAGTSTNLALPLEQIARTATKRGMIVLISDLLAPLADLQSQFGTLRSRGHEVVVVRVLDPAEATFGFDEAVLFEDLESGRQLYVDPQSVRQTYLERFGEHTAAIQTICNHLGIEYHSITTDQPLELALFDFLNARLHRGRHVARRASSGRARGAGGGA